LERVILETDAPYLAPQPWRGRRNEPAHLTNVVEVLATLRGQAAADVAETTSANAMRLFGPRLEHARDAGMAESACA
jgi:TatD DNase family protein